MINYLKALVTLTLIFLTRVNLIILIFPIVTQVASNCAYPGFRSKLTLAHSHTLTYSHTLTLSHLHIFTYSNSCRFTNSHTLTQLPLSHTHTHTMHVHTHFIHTFTNSYFHTLIFSLTRTLSHNSHFHTVALSLTLTLSHSSLSHNSLTLTLS
jgi:hypothetical protein